MTFKRVAGVAVGTAVLFSTCAVAPASAINNIKGFGVEETLKNYVSLSDFNSEIGYTVRNLRPSRDPVRVNGRLYEANIVAKAVVGTVFPQPNDFRARTASGADYPALFNASTLNGGPLGPGSNTAGKLYFDVVGENPDSVIYNRNFEDLLGWVGLQPIDPESVVPGTDAGSEAGGGGATSAPSTGDTSGGGAAEVPGSTGPNLATPPQISNGAQNGPYGPSGSVPPFGN